MTIVSNKLLNGGVVPLNGNVTQVKYAWFLEKSFVARKLDFLQKSCDSGTKVSYSTHNPVLILSHNHHGPVGPLLMPANVILKT